MTFYYPWYGIPNGPGGEGRTVHWGQIDQANKNIEASTHYPALGAYDSHDPNVIDRHCRWAKRAGIDTFIVSWWGHGDFSDRAMPKILDGCQHYGLTATIYYETIPRPQNPQSAADDITKILEKYAKHPAFLKVSGKPVVFIYGRTLQEMGLSDWRKAIEIINTNYKGGFVAIGDQFSQDAARTFDGLHTYNTAGPLKGRDPTAARKWAAETYPAWVKLADGAGKICAITVIPGYDDTKIRKPGLAVERYNGELYRAQWEEAIKADPHWILVTSFNEWHEGSEIEPSEEYKEQYIDLTAEYAKRFKAKDRIAQPTQEKIDNAAIVRKAVASQLKKKPEDINEGDYAKVRFLDLSHSPLSDLEPLKGLSNLKTLRLFGTQASNIEPLKGLSNLQELLLSFNPISNIEPLKELSNLQHLFLDGTKVRDIEPLKVLSNLQGLSLGDTQVSNIEPLKGLTNLQDLVLSKSKVINLEPLKGLSNLSALWLEGTQVSNFEPLNVLSSLQMLDLSGTQISDLEPLKGLSKLQTLDLSDTKVTNLEPLKGLSNLQALLLSGTKIRNIEPLKVLSTLKMLDLSGTQISDLEPLKGLSNLHTLFLSFNPISDIEPLKELSNLKHLKLSNTPVSNIELLKGLSNMQELDLAGTKVSDIEPLKELSNLQTLNLISTQVSNLEPLKGLQKLQTLTLYGTNVSNIEPLKGLSKLQRLGLSSTQVSNIESLKGLSNLQLLGLSSTPVSDKQVDELKKALPKLEIFR
jgi:Leucine-rich repeat (LRR) protein